MGKDDHVVVAGGMEVDEKTCREMLAAGHKILDEVKEKHGRAVAQLVSELANVLNVGKMFALEGQSEMGLAVGQMLNRMMPALHELTKIDNKELAEMVTRVATARLRTPGPDISKMN